MISESLVEEKVQRGRTPSGSRIPMSESGVMTTSEYAPSSFLMQ
jgi:hypothetical protein